MLSLKWYIQFVISVSMEFSLIELYLKKKTQFIQLLMSMFFLLFTVTNCTFPQRWEGSWFLSGNQQPVFIKGSTLSFRGKCVASDGDKFLIVDE